jgi:PAS domain S-box-containing protein
MNSLNGFIPPVTTTALRYYKAAFSASNNRTVVFTAIRNHDNTIIDFEFSLLSSASIEFFNGEDVTGKKFMELWPDEQDQFADMVRVIETGETLNRERQIKDNNGIAQWLSVSDCKVDDCIVRIWENVTERHRLDENSLETIARKAEEKYVSLFKYIDQGFCIIEMVFDENDKPYDYIFLDYNPAFEKQTGLKNAHGLSIKTINPNHEQYWFDFYGEIAKTGQPKYFEQEAVLINGWFEASAFPLSNERDNKVAVIFSDITARKKAEAELVAFTSRLEMEVKERTATLNQLNVLLEDKNVELEKSNKELESFNYIASHDLQEPLRKIQTFLSMITKRGNDRAAVDAYMDKISSSADRMSNLIQDVLAYSRLSVDNQFTDVDLNRIIDNVLSDYELVVSDKNAIIYKSALPVIKAIPLQMHQLFANLISNSLKYNDGEPIINITANDVEGNPNMVEITLTDNGIGFDQKYSDQIFTLFKRLHGKSEYAGTGIGLSICKKIVEQHHGTIAATSNEGRGAKFTIQLPV